MSSPKRLRGDGLFFNCWQVNDGCTCGPVVDDPAATQQSQPRRDLQNTRSYGKKTSAPVPPERKTSAPPKPPRRQQEPSNMVQHVFMNPFDIVMDVDFLNCTGHTPVEGEEKTEQIIGIGVLDKLVHGFESRGCEKYLMNVILAGFRKYFVNPWQWGAHQYFPHTKTYQMEPSVRAIMKLPLCNGKAVLTFHQVLEWFAEFLGLLHHTSSVYYPIVSFKDAIITPSMFLVVRIIDGKYCYYKHHIFDYCLQHFQNQGFDPKKFSFEVTRHTRMFMYSPWLSTKHTTWRLILVRPYKYVDEIIHCIVECEISL